MRPRLTAADLAAVYDEAPSPAMRRVLWEVARLQSTIKRAHQVRKGLGDDLPRGVNPTVWAAFCSEIDEEPCLADKPTARQTRRIAVGVAKVKAGE